MTRIHLDDDDVLLGWLGDALDEADPVSPRAVEAAIALSDLAGADAELAALVADSLVDQEVMLFRHDAGDPQGAVVARLVTFATPEFTIDVDLEPDGATLVGVISPPMAVEVEIQSAAGSQVRHSDDLGRFNVRLNPGSCRLVVHAPTGNIVTPWVTR